MKLHELVEQHQHVIEGDVVLPKKTTKLNYANVIVRGAFDCSDTKITSLIGSPKEVGGDFSCMYTEITSLIGVSKHVGGNFSCASCSYLTSLEDCPNYAGGDFDFFDTKITSLQNIHKQIKYIGGELHMNSKAQSHILGVMLIKGLKKIVVPISHPKISVVEDIINKHLAGDRDVHATQEDLLEAGLREYAKL